MLTPEISERRDEIVEEVNQIYFYFHDLTWQRTTWLGAPIWKCPLDLWTYQEILWQVRPDTIIETGTLFGGSALYLATLCDLLGHGRVITIDIEKQPDLPQHDRITYVNGSSVDPDIVSAVEREATGVVMVVLDSNHTELHVLRELAAYGPIVTRGSYLVVEDTNISSARWINDKFRGPMEAVETFLAHCDDFVVDKARENSMVTFNPKGYLCKVKGPRSRSQPTHHVRSSPAPR